MKDFYPSIVPRPFQGFTLIELMIAVAILAIIMAIAYPSYQNQVRKSHRGDVQAEMMELAHNLERCFTRTNAYNACGIAGGLSESERYNIQIDPHTASAYTITAVPQAEGGQNSDICASLSLDHLGVKGTSAAGLSASDCW